MIAQCDICKREHEATPLQSKALRDDQRISKSPRAGFVTCPECSEQEAERLRIWEQADVIRAQREEVQHART